MIFEDVFIFQVVLFFKLSYYMRLTFLSSALGETLDQYFKMSVTVCVTNFQASDWSKVSDVARRRTASYDVARLLLMAPIDPWRNSTPDFGAVAFCTTNIEDFRTPLTSTSSTISSTYSSQKRSLRWTSSKRKIMVVIEVGQLENTYNERLSETMPLSGLKSKNENDPKEEDDL